MEARRNYSEQVLEKEDKNDEAICLGLLRSVFDELTKFYLKLSDLEKRIDESLDKMDNVGQYKRNVRCYETI